MVLLIARLLLAGVLIVSGLAKLVDLPGSRKALVGFGMGQRLAGPAATALPLVELCVALALVPTASAWYGAIAALGLFVMFVAVVGYNLARGRRPECHCFGQLHSEPIGWSTLARNGVLAAVAGLVAWLGSADPGPSGVDWLTSFSLAQQLALAGAGAVLAVFVLQTWVLLQMLHQQGRVLLRLDELERWLPAAPAHATGGLPTEPGAQAGLVVGAPAPQFRLDGLRGETLTLSALLAADKPLLLLFTNPNCGPCQSLLPDASWWQRTYASRLNVALISEGSIEDNRSKSAEHGLSQVLLQVQREVAEAYQAYGTPAGVMVRPDGSIGSPLAMGPEAIRTLVFHVVGLELPVLPPGLNGNVQPSGDANGTGNGVGNGVIGHASPSPVGVGQLAPTLSLKDMTGAQVSLSDFVGRETALLFWNPGCGFCQSMLEDLKRWEADVTDRSPAVVVISTGSVEANRALGLRSPLLLDQNFKAGAAFGANGTPMAVLLDANGRVSSSVAAGAPAVFDLLRAPALDRRL